MQSRASRLLEQQKQQASDYMEVVVVMVVVVTGDEHRLEGKLGSGLLPDGYPWHITMLAVKMQARRRRAHY